MVMVQFNGFAQERLNWLHLQRGETLMFDSLTGMVKFEILVKTSICKMTIKYYSFEFIWAPKDFVI